MTSELPFQAKHPPKQLEDIQGMIGEGLKMLSPYDRQIQIDRYVPGRPLEERSESLDLNCVLPRCDYAAPNDGFGWHTERPRAGSKKISGRCDFSTAGEV